ncbi:MAG: hypothetical protein WBQ17_13645 [Rhizomicrobium sp.]
MKSMPRDIRRYIYLQVLALVLSTPPVFTENLAIASAVARLAIETAALLVTIAIFVLLLWLVAWRRKNWARWLCVVLYIVSVPLVFFEGHYDLVVMQVFKWAATVSAGLSYVFLFSKDSRLWFSNSLARSEAGDGRRS